MAPKIIDRIKKRDELISKAYDYVLKFGIADFSTDSFIRHFQIGKSSLYHYFRSKDEIIYALYYRVALSDIERSRKQIRPEMSLREKLAVIFDFYLSDDLINRRFQEIYKEFLQIYHRSNKPNLEKIDSDLMGQMQELIETVLQEEIDLAHIQPESIGLVNSMIVTADGMLLYAFSLEEFNLSEELGRYLDSLVAVMATDETRKSDSTTG